MRRAVCSPRLRGIVALGLSLCLLPSLAAGADGESPRIVLLAPEGESRVALRIRAELRALHFDVVDMQAPEGPPSREPLEEAARSSDAVAAVRIVPSKAGIEVWIVDRVTSKTVLREIVSRDARSTSGEADIALRVMELLRASLMEIDAPTPPRGEIAPPPRVRALVSPRQVPPPVRLPVAAEGLRGSFSVDLGMGMLLAPGNIGPAGLLHVAAGYRPVPWIGPMVLALVPVHSLDVRGPEGTAAVRMGLFGAGAEAALAPGGPAWSVTAGAGVSVFWLTAEGSAAGPFFGGRSTGLVTAAPFVRVGARLALLPRLHVRADVLGGATVQQPVIQFAGREAASFGAPFFAPSAAFELSWP